jgi:hypothetical protein
MKKRYFSVDKKLCNDLAMDYFAKSAGLNRIGPKYDRIREGAMRMRQAIEDKIDLRAECVFFEKDECQLDKDNLIVGGQTFSCKAFELVDPEMIEGMFVYACCAGDYAFPEEDILDQVYADIWGSAFTDAIRSIIKQDVGKNCNISENFGPGFYGMSTRALGKLEKILDFGELGIEVRNGNIMIPLKSCAGMFFSVKDGYEPVSVACETCYGNQTSCKLCQVYIDAHQGK